MILMFFCVFFFFFKQKTAYEMLRSLVGSEMCIRDRVKTDFAKALYAGKEERVAAGYPLGRLGTPQDTAKLAAFLLSDDASWITGECVTIDGGVTLGSFAE